jgi:hypothetical protein
MRAPGAPHPADGAARPAHGLRYRPEVDGLRAIAVLPVILFHAGAPWFGGGYVGVDVFFVISGYLITSILVEDLERGRFSLARFYERRARRILPALFFVLACTSVAAWVLMVPSQFEEYARALVAVVFFVSNIHFWRVEDYFAPAAEQNPLLHTWSLAVEEQCYIFFPLLLLLLWRLRGRKALQAIVVLTLASLLLSEWGRRHAPTSTATSPVPQPMPASPMSRSWIRCGSTCRPTSRPATICTGATAITGAPPARSASSSACWNARRSSISPCFAAAPRPRLIGSVPPAPTAARRLPEARSAPAWAGAPGLTAPRGDAGAYGRRCRVRNGRVRLPGGRQAQAVRAHGRDCGTTGASP